MVVSKSKKQTLPPAENKAVEALQVATSEIRYFNLEDIEIDPIWNERDKTQQTYIEHINFLVDSIRKHGIRTPLKGYLNKKTGKMRPYDGECRYIAATKLEEEGIKIIIPMMVDSNRTSDADRVVAMLVDNSGLPFTYAEQSKVVRRLVNYGWDLPTIGEYVKGRKSLVQLQDLLDFSDATQETKELVREGLVKPTTVVKAVRADGADDANTILQTAVAIAQELDTKVTANFVDDIRNKILSDEIQPEKLIPAKSETEAQSKERKKNVRGAANVVANPKKMSVEDILEGNVDPEELANQIRTSTKKERKTRDDSLIRDAVLVYNSLKVAIANGGLKVIHKHDSIPGIPDNLVLHCTESLWEEILRLMPISVTGGVKPTAASDPSSNGNGESAVLEAEEVDEAEEEREEQENLDFLENQAIENVEEQEEAFIE